MQIKEIISSFNSHQHTRFENMLTWLESDINKAKNLRFAAIKKRQFDVCKQYYTQMEEYTMSLENDMLDSEREHTIKINTLKDHILRLECILLIHGVNDYPAWFAKGAGLLIDLTLELSRKNEIYKVERLINNEA